MSRRNGYQDETFCMASALEGDTALVDDDFFAQTDIVENGAKTSCEEHDDSVLSQAMNLYAVYCTGLVHSRMAYSPALTRPIDRLLDKIMQAKNETEVASLALLHEYRTTIAKKKAACPRGKYAGAWTFTNPESSPGPSIEARDQHAPPQTMFHLIYDPFIVPFRVEVSAHMDLGTLADAGIDAAQRAAMLVAPNCDQVSKSSATFDCCGNPDTTFVASCTH